MTANAEIDLGERVHAEAPREVDQQRDLDAVVRLERDHVERAATERCLAGEGLADLAEPG